jgi:eukaryotic-like serine/threonine-protein kinase
LSISIGSHLGSHEITALLGKGGMGEVYRARDLKLKRDVAIKILPDEFSLDPARVSRFQREAEVLASLNHPNIAAIYDLEVAGETRFLVLELVEGETLAERIQRGRIPFEESLEIGKHICEALEAAHEKGVVHRDLKPANVKITSDGRVKVLDFGLAKAIERTPASGTLSNSPTLTIGATQAGVILGTAAYMSPEQAKGFEVDARSDTFSFGSVFFEMLTGQQAFPGDTVAEVLASVLVREPDFSLLPPNLNPRIHELLQRCIQKNPKRRWQAAGDLRAELETIAAAPRLTPATAQPLAKPRLLWKLALPLLITAIVFATIGNFATWNLKRTAPSKVVRFPVEIGQYYQAGRSAVAISPDGTRLVYAAINGLFMRAMNDTELRPIPGSSNLQPSHPFFSPDGQWVGFYSTQDSTFKKIAVTGGAALTICKTEASSAASWTGDQIVFSNPSKGIMRVSSDGGEPEVLVSLKPPEAGAMPQILDNGRLLLFTLFSEARTGTEDKGQIVVQSLGTGERKIVLRGGSAARYAPTGHLLYVVAGTLLAIPFDLKTLQVRGQRVSIIEDVRRATDLGATAEYSFSDDGSLVYILGTLTRPASSSTLAFADRNGKAQSLPLPPQPYYHPRVSPDGKQIVYGTDDGTEAIVWIYDLNAGGAPRRLTFEGRNTSPIWSPDGQRITFESDRAGDRAIFLQPANGGAAERLTKAEPGVEHRPEAWTPDGKTLAFLVSQAGTGDIWTLTMDGERKSKPLVERPGSNERYTAFSPNGRWFAYVSTEVGNMMEVFVQPFPPTRAKYQISTEASLTPAWSPDGKQLFYGQQTTDRIVAVDINTAPTFSFGKPVPLPIERAAVIGSYPGRNFDITPDGKQFLVVMPTASATDSSSRQINVVLNWFSELQQRVPVK